MSFLRSQSSLRWSAGLSLFVALGVGALVGCTATIPEGQLVCATGAECPRTWVCVEQRCFSSLGATDAGLRDGGARDGGGVDAEVAPDGGDASVPAPDASATDASALDAGAADAGGPALLELDPTESITGAASARFGHAVALSGVVFAVGAPELGGGGAIHLGSVGTAAFRTIPVAVSNGRVGESLAMSGDRVYVGAPGMGQVFEVSSATDTVVGATPPAAVDGRGAAIALAGSELLVGAPRFSNGNASAGSVTRFPLPLSLSEPAPELEGGMAFGNLGRALGVSGPTAVIGARGRAFVAQIAGLGTATTLDDPRTPPDESFGQAVAISESNVFVGSPPLLLPGRVCVYDGEGLQATLTRPIGDPGDADGFGAALCVTPDLLVVGAPSVESGEAFFYRPTSAGYQLAGQFLRGAPPAPRQEHGFSCAISGALVLIGAPGEGVVRVYTVPPVDP